jgi:hypothetical protein
MPVLESLKKLGLAVKLEILSELELVLFWVFDLTRRNFLLRFSIMRPQFI